MSKNNQQNIPFLESDDYTIQDDIIDTTLPQRPNPINFKILIGQYVKLLQIKMNSNEFILLKKSNPDEYIKRLSAFVPLFKEEYPHLFKMIISGTDLEILDIFLNNITDIDSGKKSLNEARNNLGNILHNKFVNK